MLRAACTAGPVLNCERLWLGPYVANNIVHRAYVSTNSAIHRGIRRSTSRLGRDESGSRYDKIREDRKPTSRSRRDEFGSRYDKIREDRKTTSRSGRDESGSRYDKIREDRKPTARSGRDESTFRYDGARNERKSNPKEGRPLTRRKEKRMSRTREIRPDEARNEKRFDPRESRPEPVSRYDESARERKSAYKESRPEPASRFDEARKPRFTAELQTFGNKDKSPGPWAPRSPKPPRPNHQAQQDVEDIRQLANSRNDRRTIKQRNYLQGGAREPDPTQNFRFTDSKLRGSKRIRYKIRGSRRTADIIRGKPSALMHYEKATSSTHSSDIATRRTSKYEHTSDTQQESNRPDSPRDSLRQPSFTLNRGSRSDRSSLFKSQEEDDDSHIHRKDPPLTVQDFEFAADNSLNLFDDIDSLNEHSRRYPKEDQIHDRESTNSGGPRTFTINRGTRNKESGLSDRGREGKGESVYSRKDSRRSNGPPVLGNKSPDILESTHDTLAIPYTTPASEFLYGTSVVTAALKSAHRKLYKLYIYAGENREAGNQDEPLRKLALAAGVQVIQMQEDKLRLMNKMSLGRAHNVY